MKNDEIHPKYVRPTGLVFHSVRFLTKLDVGKLRLRQEIAKIYSKSVRPLAKWGVEMKSIQNPCALG
ncbi:MAG: hypothetical protein IKA74_00370 [Clostridia bacterium]|nr:hypothetical protein [Clostridia bacterium]